VRPRCVRAAAAGYVGENLYQAVSSVIAGKVDLAITAVCKIGHSSGWDMPDRHRDHAQDFCDRTARTVRLPTRRRHAELAVAGVMAFSVRSQPNG